MIDIDDLIVALGRVLDDAREKSRWQQAAQDIEAKLAKVESRADKAKAKIAELLDWENRALNAEAELAALKGEKP